jgi:hypothetical protein
MHSSDRLLCTDESLFGAADSPPRSTESIEFADRFGLFDVPLKVLMLYSCWRNMVVASSNEQERGTIIIGKVVCRGCVGCEVRAPLEIESVPAQERRNGLRRSRAPRAREHASHPVQQDAV